MRLFSKHVSHFTIWHHAYDQYRDTEIWLYRRVVYRLLVIIPVWQWTWRKAYIPIWSWAANEFNGAPVHLYSNFGGDEVKYDWTTGEVSRLQLL